MGKLTINWVNSPLGGSGNYVAIPTDKLHILTALDTNISGVYKIKVSSLKGTFCAQ